MRSIFYAGAAIVAAAGLSVSAQATEFLGGAVTMTGPINDAGTISYTGGFTATHKEDFVDTWTFGPFPEGTGIVDGSAINQFKIGATANSIVFTSATLNGIPLDIVPGTLGGYNFITVLTNVDIFSSGVNTLVLSGTSGANATYSGLVNFTVAPVPEPTTWAMMIAGIGIVGFAMRRRANRVAVSFS